MRIIIVLFAAAFFILIASCSKTVDSTARNRVVIDRWLELWNTGDLSIADEILAPGFASHIPHFSQITDTGSYKAEIARSGDEIPDFHAVLEDFITKGDKAAGRFTATGTAQGVLAGMPVDSTRYTNTWIVVFRFADGKIAEEWWQFDLLGVMQQVGAMPPMPEGPPAMQRTAPEDFAWSAPSQITGDLGNPESNKALVLRVYRAWNSKNADTLLTTLDEIYAKDFIYHDPARPHVTDLAGYKKWVVEEVLTPFPDFTMPMEDIFAEGDKVVDRWKFTGTFSPFGKPLTQTGTSISRIADGKIVEEWCDFDMLGTVQQLKAMMEQ